jgi:Family of unknown function (DUF6515)
MKTFFRIALSLSLVVLVVSLISIPQETFAQRFNHPNFSAGGGGSRGSAPAQNFSRPAPAPAAFHPAPPVNRPAPPVSHPAPVQYEPRPTINGGSYNTGNHQFHQSSAPVRNNVNIHENVTAQRNVTVHENVNVYHNHYNPVHAYAYHPYHPYYWGHNWHPLGYFAASLATDAFLISLANQQYYYDDGVYYQPYSGGYSVVPAPIGALVGSLPPGYETTMVGNDTYFYYGGVFYIYTGSGYQVVAAPIGAIVTQIPDGAVQQDINGQTFLVYNNTYYQPISQDGQDAYEVVQVN